jgi:hypothetical protein
MATAQLPPDTVVNPSSIEFDPSADHDVMEFGAPKVDRYELRNYLMGAAQPIQAPISLGKPAPGTDGKIRIRKADMPVLFSVPAMGVLYESRVAAIGPGGEGVSTPSNPFGIRSQVIAPGKPAYRLP